MSDIEKLREISKRMEGQDNRITADPIFVVQQRKRIYGMDPQWGGSITWIFDGDEYVDGDEGLAEAKAYYEEHGKEPDEWTHTAYIDTWEFVQPFFSQIAADKYIRVNRHRLTDPRVYVESAYRNSEWQAVRGVLLSLTESGDK